jgi:DNA-binding transcriptional regulator YhcF (GntR family)
VQRIQLAEALNHSVGRGRGRDSEAGTCMLAVGAIAALTGVSETTVRRVLRQAKVLGFVAVEKRRLGRFRNETNVVRSSAARGRPGCV